METKPAVFRSGMRTLTPVIMLEIARTDAELAKGLMGRKGLKPTRGMLFSFVKTARWPFWMKNVPFPIDLAWLAENGRVLETRAMTPGVAVMHFPAQASAAAVELPRGFITRYGIKVGDHLVSAK